jgi:hypothetical protein
MGVPTWEVGYTTPPPEGRPRSSGNMWWHWRKKQSFRKRFIRQSYTWFQTFALFWMLYAYFWVIPRRLNFICRLFGTLCLIHLHRRVGSYLPMKMEQSIPKRQHIKFRRRGITQKKAYNKVIRVRTVKLYKYRQAQTALSSERFKYNNFT